jgi:hypothetical protein
MYENANYRAGDAVPHHCYVVAQPIRFRTGEHVHDSARARGARLGEALYGAPNPSYHEVRDHGLVLALWPPVGRLLRVGIFWKEGHPLAVRALRDAMERLGAQTGSMG